MKKVILGVGVCLFLALVLLTGCGKEKPSVFSETVTKKINLEAGITVGNHTYLPINVKRIPAGRAEAILQVLDAFEKKHPELEVTSWNIEKNQETLLTSPYIYGIWVNHRPKK